jgi:peptide/nickel transport system substrate-binding protein
MTRPAASVLSGLCLALAACAPEPTCSGDWCGTAVVVTAAEADVLLPVATTQDVGYAIGDLLFLKLADVGPDMSTVGGFEPELANEWVFEDDRTIRFTLHPDARWHDGAPVTAEDVVFTFDVYRDSVVASTARPRLEGIAAVAARDAHTVVFRFRRPYQDMLFDAVYHMRVLPKHLLDTIPRTALASHPFGRGPVGNGPYRFVRWRAGQSIELTADSAFFLGRPGVRRVIWRFTADVNTAVAQFLAGEADVVNALPPDALQRVRSDDQLRAIPWTPSTIYGYVLFNHRDPVDHDRPHPLFGNRSVRRAVAMAVDRPTLVRAVFGPDGIVAQGPMSPSQWIAHEEYEQVPFDTAGARRALAALGWRDSDGDGVLDKDGAALQFDLVVPNTSTARRRSAEILQEQLRRAGITMTLSLLDFGAFMERGQAHRFDAWFGSYGGDPSPASIAEVWVSDAGYNYGSYANPVFDDAVRRAQEALDVATARTRWHRAVSIINDDVPAIWIYGSGPSAGVHGRFENVSVRPDNFVATLWQWRVPAARLIDRDRYSE